MSADKQNVSQNNGDPGLIGGLSRQLKLVLRLLGDRRINPFYKLLPVGALIYLISPIDAIPFIVDDAVVIGLGTYFFIELCPADIVEEHRASLMGSEPNKGDVVDAEFSEASKDG